MTARAADQPTAAEALTVCEAVKKLDAVAGKPFAIVGRLSFRAGSEFMSQEDCVDAQGAKRDAAIALDYDSKDAPHVKTGWEVAGAAMQSKLALVRRYTTLATFPFGTSDYDRWAVVYGCLRPASAAAPKMLPGCCTAATATCWW